MSTAKNFQFRLQSKTSDTADEYSDSKSGKLQRSRSIGYGRRPTVMHPNDRAPFSSSTTKTTAAAQPSRFTFNRTQPAMQQIHTSVTPPLADCSHEVPGSLPAIVRPEEFERVCTPLCQVATTSATSNSYLQPANSEAQQLDILPSALSEVQREAS